MSDFPNVSLADIAASIAEMRIELGSIAAYLAAKRTEPVAVSASEVAKMLSINRGQVYQLHRDGDLNGFRPHADAHLKFLVSEVREFAQRLSATRANA